MDGCSEIVLEVSIELIEEVDCGIVGYLVKYLLCMCVSDVCGNIIDYELFIELIDNILLVFDMLEDLIFNCGEVLLEVNVSDNCGGVIDVFVDDIILFFVSCLDVLESIFYEWIVVDVCGNVSIFV